jgi:outer membrane protein assembly complex protein YaeT
LNPGSHEAPRRARGRLRLLRPLAGLLVLSIVIAALAVRPHLEGWLVASVTRTLEREYGLILRVSSVELDLLRFRLEATDLVLERAPGAPGKLSISVPYARVDLAFGSLASLRRGRVRIDGLLLDHPRVTTDAELLRSRVPRTERGRPLDLDLVARHVRLTEGVWIHEDTAHAFDLEVSRTELRATVASDGRTMTGDLRAEARVSHGALRESVVGQVATQFRLRGTRLELLEAKIRSAQGQVEGTAVVELTGPLRLDASLRTDVDLAALGRLVAAPSPVGSGKLQATLTVHHDVTAWRIEGPVEVTELRLPRLELSSVRGTLQVDAARARLEGAEARVLGGSVRGRVELPLTGPVRPAVDLVLADVDAPRFFEWLAVPVALRGRAGGTLRAEGELPVRRSWNGEGSFTLVAGADDGVGVPSSGAGTFRIDRGRLTLEAPDVHTPDTSFALAVEADLALHPTPGEIRLRGSTTNAQTTQRDVLRILAGANLRAPDIARRPIQGAGAVGARFALGGRGELDLDLDLTAGSWGTEPFDHARLLLGARPGRIDITQLDVTRGESRLAGRISFAPDPFVVREVDLEASRVEAAELATIFGVTTDLRGLVTGSVRATRGESGLAGQGQLLLSDGRWLGEPFDEATAVLRIGGDRLAFEDARVRGPAIEAVGSATLDLTTDVLEGQVASGTARIARLAVWHDTPSPIEAELVVNGPFTVDAQGPRALFELSGPALQVGPLALGSVSGQLELRPGEAELRLAGVEPGGFRGTALVGLAAPYPMRGDLTLEDWTLERATTSDELPARLVLGGHVTAAGPLGAPTTWDVEGELARATIDVGTRVLDAAAAVPLVIHGGTLELGPFEIRGEGVGLRGHFGYALDAERIDGSLDGTIDLAASALLVRDLRAEGSVDVTIEAHGTRAAPELTGSLRLSRGRARYLGLPYRLEALSADVALHGSTAEITALHGVIGGGEVDGSGRVELGAGGISSFALTLDGRGVRLEMPAEFDGVYDAKLDIGGSPERILVRGHAELLRGLWSSELERPQLFGGSGREYAPGESSDLAQRTFLEIDVHAANRVWVRNRLAEIEAAVDLQVGGTIERPQVLGRVFALEGGRIEYRGVKYQVRSGTLDFTNPDRIEPFITLEADTSVAGYEIQLRASGTPDRLTYELTSSPALSTQDIVALLATGRTLSDLETGATSTGFTGDVAANYFAGVLTDPFEDQLAKVVGLDTLRVDPLTIDRQDPTTRVTLGKEIRDDLTVLYSHRADQAEEDLYQVEWRANRRATVTAERATNGGVGANLYYTHRYWWRKPPPLAATGATPAESTGGARVGAVTVSADERFDPSELRQRIALKTGEPYRRADVYVGVDALRRTLVDAGYLEGEVFVDPVESAPHTFDLEYRVRAGKRYTVEFEGVRSKEERKLRQTLEKLWADSLFVGDLYGDSVEAIRSFFQGRGYYAVDVEHELVDGSSPVLHFRVDRGAEVEVASVAIEGASEMGEERVRRQMLTRAPGFLGRKSFDPAVLEADVAAIRTLYRNEGYLDVRVERPELRLSAKGDTVDVRLRIHEGPRYRLRKLEFPEVPGIPEEQLAQWTGLHPGQPVSRSVVADAEAALRRALDRAGRAGASVHAIPAFSPDGAADLRFEIAAGPQMHVAAIRVEGNFLTRDETIRDALGLKVGDTLTREEITQAQRALYRLGTLQSVHVDHEPLRPGDDVERVVYVRVTESRPLRLAVGAGYNTESRVNLSLGTSFDNVAGRGRSVGMRAIVNADLENFQLFGRTPKLFGSTTPGLASLLWETDSQTPGFSVERWSVALRAERKFSPHWQGFLRYAYQLIDVFDIVDPVAVQQEQVEDAKLGSVEGSLTYDTRDDPLAPTRGWRSSLNVAVFAPPFFSDFSYTRTTAELSRNWTLAPRVGFVSVVRAGIEDRFGGTAEVPISERFFAGGSSTIRGFDTDRLGPTSDDGLPTGGEGLFLLNEELRFPLFGALRGVAFYDAGNVYRRIRDFDPTDLRHVLGLGVRFETPIGPLRAEYGFKLDREPGESSGQFFFSIGNAF